jgi:endonuclease G
MIPSSKSVQVALNFFKVIVWYDGTGTLRTTCFKLTQEDNVGEIDFEILHFDDVFKTYQIPIGQIEAVTGLTFHANIKDNDTSGGEEDPLDGGGFERMLKKYRVQ